MSTVVRRTFVSTPQRDASATWTAIVDLLTKHCSAADRSELLAVSGIASSVIADQSPKDTAIIVTCEGPRTRVYCLYDDAAIEGDDADEEALRHDPLKGDWHVSLPCPADDLAWVERALKAKSSRITARDQSDGNVAPQSSTKAEDTLVLDTERLFKP